MDEQQQELARAIGACPCCGKFDCELSIQDKLRDKLSQRRMALQGCDDQVCESSCGVCEGEDHSTEIQDIDDLLTWINEADPGPKTTKKKKPRRKKGRPDVDSLEQQPLHPHEHHCHPGCPVSLGGCRDLPVRARTPMHRQPVRLPPQANPCHQSQDRRDVQGHAGELDERDTSADARNARDGAPLARGLRRGRRRANEAPRACPRARRARRARPKLNTTPSPHPN
jgi:hypothetical protein